MRDKTKVSRALRNVRGIGMAKATRLMSSCEIAKNRKLAGLGPRQRQALIDALH
jgi:ribosomal protein S13